MGFFEIGLFHTKTKQNVGTLWRSAYQLGASGIFTIGKRYKGQVSDTCKADRHIPLRHFETFDDFLVQRPLGALLIGIEMGGVPLKVFQHPKRAIYLLGAEDYGLSQTVIEQCDYVVSLESVGVNSFNVAVAGSIVMYDRVFSNGSNE